MYMAPVGIVNAGNPDRAYAEALDISGAHQSSYGREAAGVFAAAVAAAFAPDATVSSVVVQALRLAKDGTRAAIEAVCEAASSRHRPRVGAWRRCARRSLPSTPWARTTATRRSAPGAPPGCTPSRNSPSPWACC